MDKFKNLSSKSQKLQQCIEDISGSGLSLILSEELGEEGLAVFQDNLKTLRKMEVKSPKDEMGQKEYTRQHLGLPKARLQAELDDWWRGVSSQEPEALEDQEPSAFAFFLSELFLALPPLASAGLGTSRTAIEERRRVARQRNKVMKKLAEKLQRLSKTSQDTQWF